jgi:anti-anti-sigma factor
MSNAAPTTTRTQAVVHESLEPAEVLHVFGEIDIFSAPELESAIAGSVRIGRLLIVDFLECRYIDSTVVSILVRAHKALGAHLRIIAPPTGTVRRVLTLTAVDRILRIDTDLSGALFS